MKIKTKDIAEVALMSAVIYVLTWIHIPLPISISSGGIIHLGNIGLVVAALVFGKWKGALSAMIGMTLFDLTSAYYIWAPFTLVIRFIMGYVIGLLSEKLKQRLTGDIIAIILGGVIMLVGYFFASLIIVGAEDEKSAIAVAILSMPGDAIQVGIALLVGLPIAISVRKYQKEMT